MQVVDLDYIKELQLEVVLMKVMEHIKVKEDFIMLLMEDIIVIVIEQVVIELEVYEVLSPMEVSHFTFQIDLEFPFMVLPQVNHWVNWSKEYWTLLQHLLAGLTLIRIKSKQSAKCCIES
ncbi:MAG: hypothetical protein EZS28_048008 [Streblomastix strix]|uniref:Uncharacterized protein n=1 Tax=Streblomastix strix TaxID=222440 RepID=A0A5J4TDC9_9EUKA|nr:MAG: hypothetical protein EZS28_048008 [Streblomastix strix]